MRGKYRDVILPMTVLRRLDGVLEESKQAVLDDAGPLGGLRATRRPGRGVEDERCGAVCRWGADRRQRPPANVAV